MPRSPEGHLGAAGPTPNHFVKSGPDRDVDRSGGAGPARAIFLMAEAGASSVRTAPPFFPGMQGWRTCEGQTILQTRDGSGQQLVQWAEERSAFPRRCGCSLPGSLEDARLRASVFPVSCPVSLTPLFTWGMSERMCTVLETSHTGGKTHVRLSSPLGSTLPRTSLVVHWLRICLPRQGM